MAGEAGAGAAVADEFSTFAAAAGIFIPVPNNKYYQYLTTKHSRNKLHC